MSDYKIIHTTAVNGTVHAVFRKTPDGEDTLIKVMMWAMVEEEDGKDGIIQFVKGMIIEPTLAAFLIMPEDTDYYGEFGGYDAGD